MGSNNKKTKGSGGGMAAADDPLTSTKRMEQPLQAVLLTEDWFGSTAAAASSSSGMATSRNDHAAAAAEHYQFHPLLLDRPKVLCPLLDRATLLDYALEFLTLQGVQEVYVVCSTEAVAEYLRLSSSSSTTKSRRHGAFWSSALRITVIRDSTVTNAGDALRELDKRNVITSDPFLLMQADTVVALDPSMVRQALMEHQMRHAADSSAILTLVLQPKQQPQQQQYSHPMGSSSLSLSSSSLVVGLDPAHSNRVLVYEESRSSSHGLTCIPCSFLASHCPTMELYADTLQDTGILIASPDVLARFSDEFDYRHIHREFIANSVAEEEEGLQNKVYAVVLPQQRSTTPCYAARMATPRHYHAVARDLLRRCAHPGVLVPAAEEEFESSSCSSSAGAGAGGSSRPNHHHYQHVTARVGRTTTAVSKSLFVGAHTVVGEHVQLRGSCTTLGRHCRVADRAVISDSHLWEHCRVEEGAVIQQSILGAGVVVRAGAVIGRGCIIGAGCVIGTGVVLPPYTRLTTSVVDDLNPNNDDDEDDWESSSEEDEQDGGSIKTNPSNKRSDELVSDVAIVGPDGKGRVWKPPVDDDDDDDDDDSNVENAIPLEELLKSHCIGYDPTPLMMARQMQLQMADEELDNFSLPEKEADDTGFAAALEDDESDDALDEPGTVIIGRQEGVDVIKELKIICLEFESGTSPIENLAIELNSFKFSQNATYADCTMAATLAMLEKMNIRPDMSDARLVSEFKAMLDLWGPLLQKMSIGLDEEKAIVLALERCAVGEAGEGSDQDSAMSRVLSAGMSFRLLLQLLHDEEIVSEEAVLAWAADRKEEDGDKDTPRGRLFRLQPLQEFLDWLDEESEDDSEEEEEEENDSEEE